MSLRLKTRKLTAIASALFVALGLLALPGAFAAAPEGKGKPEILPSESRPSLTRTENTVAETRPVDPQLSRPVDPQLSRPVDPQLTRPSLTRVENPVAATRPRPQDTRPSLTAPVDGGDDEVDDTTPDDTTTTVAP